MTDDPKPTLNHFSVFRLTRDYWRLSGENQQVVQRDWLAALTAWSPGLHYYQTYPVDRRGDFMVWTAAEVGDPAAPASFVTAFTDMTTPFRRYVRPCDVLWGMTRPSPYSRSRTSRVMDPFVAQRQPYIVVYPFTKTEDWYLEDGQRRQEMMNDHIRIGKQYRDVDQLLLYSFGLQDQEFVVAYEMADLSRFSQLVYDLRATESRRYTKQDTPVHVGVHRPLSLPLGAW